MVLKCMVVILDLVCDYAKKNLLLCGKLELHNNTHRKIVHLWVCWKFLGAQSCSILKATKKNSCLRACAGELKSIYSMWSNTLGCVHMVKRLYKKNNNNNNNNNNNKIIKILLILRTIPSPTLRSAVREPKTLATSLGWLERGKFCSVYQCYLPSFTSQVRWSN